MTLHQRVAKTILVTGASGFVGLNLVEALLRRGDTVVAHTISPVPEVAIRRFGEGPGRLEVVVGDVLDTQGLEKALRTYRPGSVVHAAAITVGAREEPALAAQAIATNILGTENVLRSAADGGVPRVVYISSASVYGANAFGREPLDEQKTLPAPESVYAITKYAAERLALRLGSLRGLDVVVVRLSSAFGPWEHESGARGTMSPIWQVMWLARHDTEAVLPRPGRRDWIYSRDVAAAIGALLERRDTAERIYNLGAGNEWTVEAWCQRLRTRMPSFRYRLAERDAEANVDFHGGADRAPLRVERLGRDVGFRARFGLEAAMDDYIAWLGDTALAFDSRSGAP